VEKTHKYPIKVVSQLTGLSAYVIRAWEKRYSVLDPERTETNRRLYSEEEIEKLKLLNNAIKLGHNIGGIASLTVQELKAIIKKNGQKDLAVKIETTNLSDSSIDSFIESCINAVKSYQGKQFENLLLQASVKFSQPVLIEKLIIPLVYRIGDLWHDGTIRIANEHLASSIIRSFLSNIIESFHVADSSPKIICATPRGQEHELGALIVGVIAASEGWGVIYLGSNIPVEEIAAAAEQTEAKAVALSLVYPKDDPLLPRDIIKLGKMLPEKAVLVAGGRAAGAYEESLKEAGAIIVNDTKQLSEELDIVREKN
jgi:DNA-binding transcriptional MerR regulator/methylmalonyl-CoA mutase cobalamin-binding subunit